VTNNNPTKRCSSLGARSRLTHSSSVASRLAEALGASVEGAEGDGAGDGAFSLAISGGVPSGPTAPDDSAICATPGGARARTTTHGVRSCDSGRTLFLAVVLCGEASGRCLQLRLQRRWGRNV
jgi:hypothetical protein